MTTTLKLKELALAAGAGTFKGDWESTGVVIAAPDEGGMKYLLETLVGEDHPVLDFVEVADPNTVLLLCELADAVDRFLRAKVPQDGSYAQVIEPLFVAHQNLKGA